MNWKIELNNLKSKYDFYTLPAISEDDLKSRLKSYSIKEPDFFDFYSVTNGIYLNNFSILPFYDKKNIKKTWDSIERANDIKKTSYLGKSEELLDKFWIFSEINYLECAAIEKNEGSIWYEEDDEIHETSMSLFDFIELSLKEHSW